ncbi:MAG: alcohol dehydrogenase family protein [Rhodovibrionaceae bacterium]|nr:alcohol dehydrogenase family protein [Rhodovibrionaceae bacterium]
MSGEKGTMKGVVLTGHGGLERLEWREDLPIPEPGRGEVLIRVGAAAVNNTDINTRIAWYSKAVRGATDAGAAEGFQSAENADGGWSGTAIEFPRIQGADCCGRIVEVGQGVSRERIGERVLVRPLQTTGAGSGRLATWTFGSECDGGFAEYAKTFSRDAIAVNSDWTDIELASIPCAYSTAEGMLQRAGIKGGRLLITGASGGVGSAAVQLAKLRSARVVAMTSPDKAQDLRDLGADETIGRDDPLPPESFDAVIDLVGGPRWPDIIDALARGGRYVTAGAIAGPIVELDLRTLYLRDLTLYGTTHQTENVFPDVVRYVEENRIRPLIAEVFDLKDLRAAQQAFLKKTYIGKIAIRVGDGA